jgi:DNA-binding Lrp family transcriptional regulator
MARRACAGVDALDMRILREIGTIPFARGARSMGVLTAARLAEAVGTTRQTVDTRLARLEQEQILAGYVLWPNLKHLKLHWDIYHWKVADANQKMAAFRSLPLNGGVAAVYSFLGPDLCVDIHWRTQEERDALLARVAAIAGDVPPQTLYSREMPAIKTPLSRLDWRIIAGMRQDARRPAEHVASDIGVSARTVKRRFARMASEQAFDVTARVSLERGRRSLPFALLVHFDSGGGKRTAADLLRTFDDRCIASWVPPSPGLGHWDMSLYAESSAEIEEMREQAEKVPGVARVDVLLYTGARVDETWLDDEIRAQIDAL